MRSSHAGLLFAAALLAGVIGWSLAGGETSAMPESATPVQDRMVAPGQLTVEGRRMACGRAPTLMSRTFWDYGGAQRGMIILNPDKLETLPRVVQLFVYAHECGHQIFGPSEIQADCYAVQRGRREGWLDRHGLREVCRFFRDDPGDWVHPPGPERCAYMTRCFDGQSPQRASRGGAGGGTAR